MQFYDYPDYYSLLKKIGLHEYGVTSRSDMYRWCAQVYKDQLSYRHMMFDMMWHMAKCPYYDVYPTIIPMLTKLNLSFPGSAISKLDSDLFIAKNNTDSLIPDGGIDNLLIGDKPKFTNLLIRLPKYPHELCFETEDDVVYIRNIFMSFQPVTRERGSLHVTLGLVVGIDIGETDFDIPIFTMQVFPLDDRTVENTIGALPPHNSINRGLQIPHNIIINCIKLVITLCLLEDNQELIEPDVLTKDRHRLDDADEQLRQRLVDKAKRRGKYGFVIGRMIEREKMSPHVRRPHPALVWTGHGRKIPKIIFRKGSLIHREKIEHIPTGYKDYVEEK